MQNEWIDVTTVLEPYRLHLNARKAPMVDARHSSKMDDGSFWLPGFPPGYHARRA